MAMDGSDFFQDDCDSIAAEMKDQEERIQLKRRLYDSPMIRS